MGEAVRRPQSPRPAHRGGRLSMLGRNAFISVFDKNINLIWSTFLGDKATSNGHGVSFDPATDVQRRLFVGGAVSYEHDDYLTFEPLCDPGFGGYYQDEPLADFYTSTSDQHKNVDGFILGFDIDGFPEDPPVSIFEFENYQQMFLYPNPSSGLVSIQGMEGESFIRVVDINGKVVFEKQLVAQQPIDLSFLPQGLYVLQAIVADLQFNSTIQIIR